MKQSCDPDRGARRGPRDVYVTTSDFSQNGQAAHIREKIIQAHQIVEVNVVQAIGGASLLPRLLSMLNIIPITGGLLLASTLSPSSF